MILSIPSSTAYAVWVGIGAALAALYAIARGVEACLDGPRQKTHSPAGIELLNPT